MIIIKFFCLFIIFEFVSCFSVDTKPNVTFDEFFDYTNYPLLSFSPTGECLLIQTKHPLWNNNSYQHTLWIYNIQNKEKILITKQLDPSIKPKWSPSGNWIGLFLKNNITTNEHQDKIQSMYLYSVISNELVSIQIGNEIPLVFTWSNNDLSFYLITIHSKDKKSNEDDWKDVIQFREDMTNEINNIYQINLNRNNFSLPIQKCFIRNISFLITEVVYVPLMEKLVFTSASRMMENIEEFEVYSIDLKNSSLLSKLTENEATEEDLQLSNDGQQVLFRVLSLCSTKRKLNDTQGRLYSINLMNGKLTHIGKNFYGNIVGYTIKSDGSIYILGQLGTEVHIYTQKSPTENLIHHNGWNGTYESIATSNNNNLIAFVHSSFNEPMEVYLSNNIDQLNLAQPITDHNKLFTQRNLSQGKVYRWKNEDDGQIIEGILHYPPGQFESKNLPLLVLIHGGPYLASVNFLSHDAGIWGPLAAAQQGWLVLEPNYRGSTGYGDEFFNQIRHRPLSLPGKDILFGVDSLISDGIVDPRRLAVGGYSYGGFLTNWLITQTKRFNVGLSGSGGADHTSTWGTLDVPTLIENIFGGFPWDVPHLYQEESPIYQLDRVRTPTHIVTGEIDGRVPASQSYMLERGLYYRGIPVQLLIFPNEGHPLSNNPWHMKIKVREELKWLHKYGNGPSQG